MADFLEDDAVFSNEGASVEQLADLFQGQPKNTDVLGARDLGNGVRINEIPRNDPNDYGAIIAKKLTIEGTGDLDLGSYFATTPDLALTAIEEVSIENPFTVSGGELSGPDAGLTIGAPTVSITDGVGIAFDGLYLGVGSHDDLELTDVTLQCNKHLGLASLGDVTLTNVSLFGGHKGRVYVYAQETLTVNGAEFSENLSEIYMEARTVNLSNVDFPYGTDVTLKSELGGKAPVNGGLGNHYPNFSGSIEAGRVNFLQGVTYGQDPIMSETEFDKYRSFISIETFTPNP
jgi:hypothetical protein